MEEYTYQVKVNTDRINPYSIKRIIAELPYVKVVEVCKSNPFKDSERKTEDDS